MSQNNKKKLILHTKNLFIILMRAIGSSCSIRLVSTYILPLIEISLLGRFLFGNTYWCAKNGFN